MHGNSSSDHARRFGAADPRLNSNFGTRRPESRHQRSTGSEPSSLEAGLLRAPSEINPNSWLFDQIFLRYHNNFFEISQKTQLAEAHKEGWRPKTQRRPGFYCN